MSIYTFSSNLIVGLQNCRGVERNTIFISRYLDLRMQKGAEIGSFVLLGNKFFFNFYSRSSNFL